MYLQQVNWMDLQCDAIPHNTIAQNILQLGTRGNTITYLVSNLIPGAIS